MNRDAGSQDYHADGPSACNSDTGVDPLEVQVESDNQVDSHSSTPDDISSEIHFSPCRCQHFAFVRLDCCLVSSVAPWKFRANILGTEARVLVWSVEHLLRANRNIGKHVMCLVGNLLVALAATKGRGKSSLLEFPLRHIASLLFEYGSRLHVRWIPSDLNIADKPSRAKQQCKAQGLNRRWESTVKDFPFCNGSSSRYGASAIS